MKTLLYPFTWLAGILLFAILTIMIGILEFPPWIKDPDSEK